MDIKMQLFCKCFLNCFLATIVYPTGNEFKRLIYAEEIKDHPSLAEIIIYFNFEMQLTI